MTHWPGYCCFSTNLYSCHKGVLVHIWLLTWCLLGATRARSFLVYHLSDVSQIDLLQALHFAPVWTGHSLVLPSTVTLLSWMRTVFPGSCVSFFDYVPILSLLSHPCSSLKAPSVSSSEPSCAQTRYALWAEV